MSQNLAQLIANQARRTGADATTLLASAIVESGLNPNAVGDGGTSYGLWQNHVGGAGGPTQASAKRFLNPSVAIDQAARRFKGGSGGAWAASVQRPADQAGYARKVDAVIAQLRSGKSPYSLGGVNLNAPVSTQGLTGPSTGASGGGGKAAALSLIFGDDPGMASALAASAARDQIAPAPMGGSVASQVRSAGPIGKDYRWIQREGMKLFGLKNDPGNSQTTGGKHTNGSEHYSGRAVDFGNARNSPSQLAAWKKWAKAQGLDVLDEGDHVHVSLPGRGT